MRVSFENMSTNTTYPYRHLVAKKANCWKSGPQNRPDGENKH